MRTRGAVVDTRYVIQSGDYFMQGDAKVAVGWGQRQCARTFIDEKDALKQVALCVSKGIAPNAKVVVR